MLAATVIALVLAAPQGLQTVIWVQVIVFTIARISDNLLVPKIMSESVGVSPIVVMFATFAGGELFGLPGLLLGIPAAALAKVAWRFFRSPMAFPSRPISSRRPPSRSLRRRSSKSASASLRQGHAVVERVLA
jgi:predicted PurR-regulated permease PerM